MAKEEQAAEAKTDSRSIIIKDPATGKDVKRADWIRQVFQDKKGEYYGNRGLIAKKLTEIQGKKVPYQIVFAATKEMKDIKRPTPEKAA
jgi:hypothetical protein